jgi:hypothetical protein
MPIELSEQQQQALDAVQGNARRIRDPRTDTDYVLVPQDEYERLRNALGTRLVAAFGAIWSWITSIRPVTLIRSWITKADRQPSTWAQCFSAFFGFATVVAASVAIMSYWHSLDAERSKMAEDSIARLYPLDSDAQRLLAQHPNARRSLRRDKEGEQYKKLEDNDNAQFMSACAVLGNVFEYYVLIRGNIESHPKHEELVNAWNAYLRTICEESYGFRTYICANKEIWTRSFIEVYDIAAKDLPYDEKCANCGAVYEVTDQGKFKCIDCGGMIRERNSAVSSSHKLRIHRTPTGATK